MPRVRKTEVKALLPLLRQDWESEEDLAAALIVALDESRVGRTSYVGVIQHGLNGKAVYMGMGPYPGRKTAVKALQERGIDREHERAVVVPIMTPERFVEVMKNLDTRPEQKA